MIGRSENGLTKYLPASKTFNARTEVAMSLKRVIESVTGNVI
jgi:hypothetical protein